LRVEFSRSDNEEILVRKSRFTEAQIMGVLRQVEDGLALADVCGDHAISSVTFYKWRSKYGGMDASMISDMKVMEDDLLPVMPSIIS
jgi:putative transposase